MSKRQLRQTLRPTETGRAVHTTVLYFRYHQDGFHFIQEGEARDYLAMWQARTWGDLRRTAPVLYASAMKQYDGWNEGRDGADAFPRPGDDETFDISDIPGASDGDWPRFPPFSMLDWTPTAVRTRFGIIVSSVLNGPMLRIPVDREAAIVASLESEGFLCVRDDALARRIYG